MPHRYALDLDPRRVFKRDPMEHGPGSGAHGVTPQFLKELKQAIERKADFSPVPFTAGVQPVLLRPREERSYLIIQNNSIVNMFIGFGNDTSTITNAVLTLRPGVAYEPFQVPQNEIYISAAGAGAGGVLIYGV